MIQQLVRSRTCSTVQFGSNGTGRIRAKSPVGRLSEWQSAGACQAALRLGYPTTEPQQDAPSALRAHGSISGAFGSASYRHPRPFRAPNDSGVRHKRQRRRRFSKIICLEPAPYGEQTATPLPPVPGVCGINVETRLRRFRLRRSVRSNITVDTRLASFPAPQGRKTIAHGVSRVVFGIYRESPGTGRKRTVFTQATPNSRSDRPPRRGAYQPRSDSGGFSTDPQDAHIHVAHPKMTPGGVPWCIY